MKVRTQEDYRHIVEEHLADQLALLASGRPVAVGERLPDDHHDLPAGPRCHCRTSVSGALIVPLRFRS